MEGDLTALDITTLVIALIGLAAALLSLGSQVASWLRADHETGGSTDRVTDRQIARTIDR